MTVIEQLSNFIQTDNGLRSRNAWLEDDLMKVYVRKASHLIGHDIRQCLDIASVEVFVQQKGTWTEFLWNAHEINPWEGTHIENVLNPHLFKWLGRNGFVLLPDGFSFYLPKILH